MMPLNYTLREMKRLIQIHNLQKVNHQMYIDDVKLVDQNLKKRMGKFDTESDYI